MATQNEHSGVIAVGNAGVSLVEGAYVTLIASVVRNTVWANIYCAPIATHHFAAYLDIAIGAAAAEVNILNDFFMATNSTFDYNDCYFSICLPLQFTLGDRISARVKDTASFGVNYDTSIRIFE